MWRWLILAVVVFIWHKLVNRFFRKQPQTKIRSQTLSISPFFRRLLSNLVMGLGIMGALLLLRDYPWLKDVEDAGMDWVMQLRQKEISAMQEKNIPPLVLLDIDDKTHQAWREPLFTPRNRLKNLIDAAVKGKARLIVIDIDLSQETPVEGLCNHSLFTSDEISPTHFCPIERHPYDQKLYDYLANYKTNCKAKKITCPPIILLRNFQAVLPKQPTQRPVSNLYTNFMEKLDRDLHAPPVSFPKPRIGFLETAVAQSMPYVQWASPLFLQSDYDQIVRRWWLWQPICTEQQPGVIPSIQLLVAAHVLNSTPQPTEKELEQIQQEVTDTLSKFQPKNCPGTLPAPEPEQIIPIGKNLTVSGGRHDISQRIMYKMPWLVEYKPPYLPQFLQDKNKKTVFTIFSAQLFAESPPTANLEALKDSIVVIGGSYSDGRDIHQTPLGSMPGGLIIINAIYSLLQYGEIGSLSVLIQLLIIVLSIAIMTVAFTFFSPSWAMIFSGIVILVVWLISSIVLFDKGIWLDFTLPLLAVYYHQIMKADIEELLEPYKK